MQDDNKLKVIHSDGYIDFFKPRLIKEQLLSETDISKEDANKIQRRVSEKLRKLGIDEVSTSTIRAEVSAQLTSRGLLEEEKDSRILGMSVKEFEHLLENGCNDNANIHYSPEMITKYAYDSIAKQYALQDMPEHCAKAHMDGFVHHHDLEFFHTRPNCVNFDVRFFAKNGLMIDGKGLMGSVAKPAKTLEVILNHMLQAWMAGAVVFSGGQGYVNFNTLLAPYARGRSYEEIKQAIQGFIFNCNMSLVCRGGQILFSSIGVDLSIPKVLANEPAIGPGGIANGVYADYQEEADLIFRAILEVSEEKDGMGAYHRFPNCYASNTPIAIKKNDIIKITTIGDFVDSCIDKKCNKYFNSKVSFETQGYEILSWNTLNNYPEWKPIVTAIRNPNQDIYEVTTKKGLKMHVTKQHPFMNINGGRIKNLDKGKPLNEFKTYDRLVKLNTPILSFNENKIGTFIGFFLGDGSVDKTSKNNRILFTLYKKEKFDYLINLLDEIGFSYKNRRHIDSKDSNKIEYNISLIDTKQNDKQLSEIIKDCVLMKNSFLLDKYNNSHYYLGLLSGLINSDGSIQVNKTIDKPSIILKFSNTNTELIDLFINIGNLYGLNISKKIKQTPISNNHCLCYDLFVGGINMINLLSHISLHKIHEDKFLSLNTKYVPQNCYNSSSIKSIELIQYEGFTYDLEVADNHNYFAGQGNVLSHNCLFNIREGDLDEYSGNCKLLHEKGCNNPTLYYVNCLEMERTVMGCRTALPVNYTGSYQKDSMNTGNFMYSTLNLPLIALQAKDNAKESGKSLRQEFYNLLGDMCDIIYDTLIYRRECIIDTIYNKKMSNFLLQTDKETGEPLWDIDRTTITIGYCGLYECLQILENEDGETILNFINSKKELYHEKDGLRWSVIGSPAESAAHRFAEIIKEKYPDAPVQGVKGSYYLTNSSHIPVSEETDIIDHIKNAAKYHPLSLGGNILHIWSGEVWSDPEAIWSLNKKILETGAIFWAYSKVFTHCPECGYTINDNLEVCPICGSTHLYLYDRITGYYLGIETFNNGKKQEFKDRYRQKI